MDTERGIDVLIVVTGWDTIELNSVDVVCRRGKRMEIRMSSCEEHEAGGHLHA